MHHTSVRWERKEGREEREERTHWERKEIRDLQLVGEREREESVELEVQSQLRFSTTT